MAIKKSLKVSAKSVASPAGVLDRIPFILSLVAVLVTAAAFVAMASAVLMNYANVQESSQTALRNELNVLGAQVRAVQDAQMQQLARGVSPVMASTSTRGTVK